MWSGLDPFCPAVVLRGFAFRNGGDRMFELQGPSAKRRFVPNPFMWREITDPGTCGPDPEEK